MFDIKFLIRRKLNELRLRTGELYNFVIANRGNLPGKITTKDFTLVMKVKQVLLETGKGLSKKRTDVIRVHAA